MFPAVFNLTNLNGTNGFTIYDLKAGDLSGFSVSGAGDVNGDGIDDIIIGVPGAYGQTYPGHSCVVFGSRIFPAIFDLSNLNGVNGFTINGVSISDGSGWSVSGAGDVNGDGIDDIIIGAEGALQGAGQSYVIFGSKTFPAALNLTSLNGANGFALNGITSNDNSGLSVSAVGVGNADAFYSVSGVGDVNNDGIDDIIIGDATVNNDVGQSYVIFGNRTFPAVFNLASLNGANGFALNGVEVVVFGSESGLSVSKAGDVNADGIDDINI